MKYNIVYAKKRSEFEIQSDLFQELKDAGFNTRAEVSCFASEDRKTKKLRFDIVVFDKRCIPVLIIEVKKSKGFNYSKREQKQRTLYEQSGVPVVYFFRDSAMTEIMDILRLKENLI